MSVEANNGRQLPTHLDDRFAAAAVDDHPGLDLILCDGCGRCFATEDGPAMIAAIKGPCPNCGGRFQLASPTEGQAQATVTGCRTTAQNW